MSYIQGFIVQMILYGLIWFWQPYIGFLLCIILPIIITAILLFSSIAEKIEPSKVPRSYFKWMMISVFPPLIVMIFFVVVNQGDMYWLN